MNFRRSPYDVLYLQCSRRERLVGIAIKYRVEAEGGAVAGWLAGRVRDINAADQQLCARPALQNAALSDGRRKDVSFSNSEGDGKTSQNVSAKHRST